MSRNTRVIYALCRYGLVLFVGLLAGVAMHNIMNDVWSRWSARDAVAALQAAEHSVSALQEEIGARGLAWSRVNQRLGELQQGLKDGGGVSDLAVDSLLVEAEAAAREAGRNSLSTEATMSEVLARVGVAQVAVKDLERPLRISVSGMADLTQAALLLTAAAAVAWLLLTPGGRQVLGGLGFSSVSVLGITLDRPSGRRAEQVIRSTRQQVAAELLSWRRSSTLGSDIEHLVEKKVAPVLLRGEKNIQSIDLRATIHVEDPLFEDFLVQLTDYYGASGGAGRAFSIRFGIIGKAWRTGIPQIENEVSPDPKELIQDWAMTDDEARQGARGERHSFCAVPIIEGTQKLGIFYMDALPKHAFVDKKVIEDTIGTALKELKIVNALQRFRSEVLQGSPRIQVSEK